MDTVTAEWEQGRQAFREGVPETECPFHMEEQFDRWADWICGRGKEEHNTWLKSHPDAS